MGVNNMNKKILIISILAVLMLITISFASSTEINRDADRKESPLFRIRTRRAIAEKISEIVESIRTRFLGERMFFLTTALRNRFFQTSQVRVGTSGLADTCKGGWDTSNDVWICNLDLEILFPFYRIRQNIFGVTQK